MKSKPAPRSVLALDIGHKRVGIAGCDPLGITVSRLPALIRNNIEKELAYLKTLCEKRKVEALVIGLPLDQFGRETKQAKYSLKYGGELAKKLDLPVAWVNEHSTSWEAKERFNLNEDRSGILDSASATLILEQWLNEGPEIKPV